jgi:hypothetical protein
MIRLALILSILAAPALAQQKPLCAERIKIIYPLANRAMEAPLLESIDGAGAAIEWWGNLATGTWSILRTMPGGQTCMIMWGGDFKVVPFIPAETGEPL